MFPIFGNAGFSTDDATRLRRVEQKLDALMKHFGIDEPKNAAIDEVVQALAAGDKIGAIKAYRQATGADLTEAKRAVEAM